MQSTYYNNMLEVVLKTLRDLKPIFDGKTNEEYLTMQHQTFEKLDAQAEGLNNFEGKKTKLMEYFSQTLYPIIKSTELKKFGFKKLYAIKMDAFELRMILDKCESMMY